MPDPVFDEIELPEQAAGQLSPGNIDLNNRPLVVNSDGTVSTVRSISANIDGKEVLIPTVSEDGRIMSDVDAMAQYQQTGRHLGMFDTPENATAYAKQLHEDQASNLKFDEIVLPHSSGQFEQIILPSKPKTETEAALLETPVFNPKDEQISAAPTFFGELQAGRIGSAYHLAKEALASAMAPGQKTEPGRGKGLLGTTEHIPKDFYVPGLPKVQQDFAKAFINVVNRTAAGLTTPDMLPLAVIGGSGGAASRILAGAFGADMASNAPETWKAIQEADKTAPWSQERFEAGLDTVMQSLMFAGAAKHAATKTPLRPVESSEAPSATAEPATPQTQGSDNPVQQMVPIKEIPSETAKIGDVSGLPEASTVPVEPTGQKKIVAAAIKTQDGQVFTGTDHPQIRREMDAQGLDVARTKNEDGFVTESGAFLGREAAGKYAAEAKQIPPEMGGQMLEMSDLEPEMTMPVEDLNKLRSTPLPEMNQETIPEPIGIEAAIADIESRNAPSTEPVTFTVEPETFSPSGRKINGITVIARGRDGETLGAIEAERRKEGVFEIYNSNLAQDLKGQGNGVALYEKLINEANGAPIISDTSVSTSAANVWEALKRRGVPVEKNPNAILKENGQWSSSDGKPVFSIKATEPVIPKEPAGTKFPEPADLQNTPADIKAGLSGIARGISDSFYDAAFESLQKGRDTISGVRDPILAKAKPFFDSGRINSPEEFKSLVQSGEIDKPIVNDWTEATAESGFKLGSNKEGGFTIGGEALEKAAETVEKGKVAAGLRITGKANDLNVATGERSARIQKSFADAERAQTEIGKVATTERRQNAMSVFMEANGDAATLKKWADSAKGKMFQRAAEDAQTLTPEEIALARKVRQTFDILEQRGGTYDVLSNHRDNYVPHVWDVSQKFTGVGSSKLQDKFKFNKARTFNNFFEGDQAGFVPKTLAIGKLLPAYLHEMNRVIADRQFVRDASAGKSSEGTPLVIPRGRVSAVEKDSGGKAYLADPNAVHGMKDAAGEPIDQRNYRVLEDQPALRDWRWANKDEGGNPIFMKDDLAVHPELAKRLNAMMGQSALRQWYNEPSRGVAVIPKAIAKGLDTAQSVMKREMFGLLAPFHQVQEGTHAVGHTVNPFFGLEKMDKPTPAMIDSMKNGLMLLPEKGSGASYIEGVGGKNSFLSQVTRKFGGKAGQMLSDVIDGYQNYLFHQYIPSLKFKTYEHIIERNMKRYSKELASGEVTAGDVKMLSAEQTNAAYGHLNYAMLDRNPTMQHFLQLSLLAPDFLEARGRFAAQALKPSKAGFEQFRAIAVLAAAQAGMAFTLSKLIPNAEWDWKHPFELTVGNKTYTLRSVPEDLFRLILSGADVRRQFISARINPLLQKGIQSLTGQNYRGEKVTFTDTMGELLANYIPITARSFPGIRELTETSRNSPISPLEQLAGSMGIKISRYSPISKTYQLAHDWEKASGIPTDTGSYPVSKYQQLRYALEDGDMGRAKEEYQKLRKSMAADKIKSGFKESINNPFTGSNDEKFAKSLESDQKALYDLAVGRRKDILRRFDLWMK